MPIWFRKAGAFQLNEYLKDKEENIMSVIKIKQVKSRIGAPKDQKRTLDALGLKKLNSVVEHEENAAILGMVNKVKHLVKIVE